MSLSKKNNPEDIKHNILVADDIFALLNLKKGLNVIDCTFGTGGHSRKILEFSEDINVFCVDFDSNNFIKYASDIKDKVEFIHSNFADLSNFSKNKNIKFDRIVIDFGVHQEQIFDSSYGLSYMVDQPLNMLVDNVNPNKRNAFHLLSTASVSDLALIFKIFGEERYSSKIAAEVIRRRQISPIKTTFDLCNLIRSCVAGNPIPSYSRIFQAIRMYVNDEFQSMVKFLSSLNFICNDKCILISLSFHSFEDRIMKNFMTNKQLDFNCEEVFKKFKQQKIIKGLKITKIVKRVYNGCSTSNRKDLSFILRAMEINHDTKCF